MPPSLPPLLVTPPSFGQVVCSGFFDSIGVYQQISKLQEVIAKEWISRFDVADIVNSPTTFFQLSHGQQKLILLVRAMVKSPRLLLLDEPTHGLCSHSRSRLLGMLRVLADDPKVAIVYVTHRQDEIEWLEFPHVLRLDPPAAVGPK
jgi:molybdate transport system ATP-binding protein